MKPHPDRGDGSGVELPLGPDVPDPREEGDRYRQPGEDQGYRAHQRDGQNLIRAPESTPHEGRQGQERVVASGPQGEAGHTCRERECSTDGGNLGDSPAVRPPHRDPSA